MSRGQLSWQHVLVLMRHARSVMRDYAARRELSFWVMRGIFRRIPLGQSLRDGLRAFYIRHMATGNRAHRGGPLRNMPHLVWAPLIDGRWPRKQFDDEQKELRALSLVLRKEKW